MRPQAAKRPREFIMPRAARHNDPSHVGSSDASDVTGSGSLACAVAEMCPVFAPCDGKEREGGREGEKERRGKEGGEGEKRGKYSGRAGRFSCACMRRSSSSFLHGIQRRFFGA